MTTINHREIEEVCDSTYQALEGSFIHYCAEHEGERHEDGTKLDEEEVAGYAKQDMLDDLVTEDDTKSSIEKCESLLNKLFK